MCDVRQCLDAAQSGFAALFDVPPKALRVWAQGMTVWCNAPLQYMSKHGCDRETAMEAALAAAPCVEGLTAWHALPNGMLEAEFLADYVRRAAMEFCTAEKPVCVQDSGEDLFFEKCTAIRARRLQCTDELQAGDCGQAADAMLMTLKPVTRADVVRVAQQLELRMDENLKLQRQADLLCRVMLATLEDRLDNLA